jgi:hypothetical protein
LFGHGSRIRESGDRLWLVAHYCTNMTWVASPLPSHSSVRKATSISYFFTGMGNWRLTAISLLRDLPLFSSWGTRMDRYPDHRRFNDCQSCGYTTYGSQKLSWRWKSDKSPLKGFHAHEPISNIAIRDTVVIPPDGYSALLMQYSSVPAQYSCLLTQFFLVRQVLANRKVNCVRQFP